MAGLDENGFSIETLQNIKTDIEDSQLANINSELNVSASSLLGQLNSIMSAKLREMWEVAEAVYAAFYPDSASGVSLDNVASLTGTVRLPAVAASGTLTIDVDAGFSANAGDLVCYPDATPSWLFSNTAAVSSVGADPALAVVFEAQEAGDKFVAATVNWTIASTFTGWNSVGGNAADIDNGRDLETDAELRIRRENELDAQGHATVESIRSDMLQVTDVTSATVFENTTDVTVGILTPHSIRVVVLGGTDADVAEGLFDTKAAGIETIGSSSAVVTDSQGINHTINFDRASEEDIAVEADITVVTGTYPADGDSQVKAALVAHIDGLGLGVDVILSQLTGVCLDIAGVNDVTVMKAAIDPAAPAASNVTIAADEIANGDTSLITLNVTYIGAVP
jgi:uncharacterized phage protein gp47/JayE